MAVFFLSYAHSQKPDSYLDRFFEDLTEAVRRLAPVSLLGSARRDGAEPEPLGFIDGKGIELGETWSPRLAEALNHSRVFVPLYTPQYFHRKVCGQEWMLFRKRQEFAAAVMKSGLPPVILPVLWGPPSPWMMASLPHVAAELQYRHDELGEIYARDGLRYLIQRNRARYIDFLEAFAKKIVNAAVKHSLPSLTRPELERMEDAFEIAGPGPPGEPPPKLGPKYLKFVYVAARRNELAELRSQLDSYGEVGGYEWQPYHPVLPEKIETIARNIADGNDFYYDRILVDDQSIQRLKTARRNHNIAVLIADTWSLRIQQYSDFARKCDEEKEFNDLVVIVPWNLDDAETQAERPLLEKSIEMAFPQRSGARNRLFFNPLESPKELAERLTSTLHNLRKQRIERAPVRKARKGVKFPPLPIPAPPEGEC